MNDERGTMNRRQRPRRSGSGARHAGFSLTEVMFAVIIMGVGFIMVAAIFPVAIQQAKNTSEETIAAAVAPGAVETMDQIAAQNFSLNNNTITGRMLVATDLLIGKGGTLNPPVAVADAPTSTDQIPGNTARLVRGKVIALGDERMMEEDPSNPNSLTAKNLRTAAWNAVRNNLVLPSDSRFGWVVMYRRDRTYRNTNAAAQPVDAASVIKEDSDQAQIFVIPVEARARSAFSAGDDAAPVSGTVTVRNLQPRPVLFQIEQIVDLKGGNKSGAYYLRIMGNSLHKNAVAEGAYLVVSDDMIRTTPGSVIPDGPFSPNAGRMNGQIYRIGARRSDLDLNNNQIWEFAPGSEFRADSGADGKTGTADDITTLGLSNAGPAIGLVVGRSYADPANPGSPPRYEGPSMAISCYTTFLKVN